MDLLRRRILGTVILLAASACREPNTTPSTSDDTSIAARRVAARDPGSWLADYVRHPRPPLASDPAVLAGAGDIARCYPGEDVTQFQRPGPANPATQTARLLEKMKSATVMAVGDNAYEFGSPIDYAGCYDPTWGTLRSRTRPSTGNHEYLTPGAAGYFAYFGQRAAPPLGYYSYDLGSWHVVVINSTPQVYACWPPEFDEVPPGFPSLPVPPNPGPDAGRACAGDIAQQAWLAADLASHRDALCTIAYFHHPRFSSGMHGNQYQMQKMWDILYAGNADVVVSGHDHLYERFAPQNPDGGADGVRGIRQFTVGTGGAEFYSVSVRQPNSEVLINTVHGVLALALGNGQYGWSFVGIDGNVADSGSGTCH